MEAPQSHTFCPYAPGRKNRAAKLKIVRNGRRGGGVMLFYDTAIILTPTPPDYTNMGYVHSQLSRQLSLMKGFEDATWA